MKVKVAKFKVKILTKIPDQVSLWSLSNWIAANPEKVCFRNQDIWLLTTVWNVLSSLSLIFQDIWGIEYLRSQVKAHSEDLKSKPVSNFQLSSRQVLIFIFLLSFRQRGTYDSFQLHRCRSYMPTSRQINILIQLSKYEYFAVFLNRNFCYKDFKTEKFLKVINKR